MSEICISNCVNNTRIPASANYVNLYKWPESAAARGGVRPRSRVVDSVSCRQMYLRSYKFSRKETVPERTMRFFGRVRERMAVGRRKQAAAEEESLRTRRRRRRRRMGHRRRVVVLRRVKDFSCAVLCRIFRRMLFCSASVDVVDRGV